MLDKTLPYLNIIMKRNAGLPITVHRLPSTFSFEFFKPNNEIEWATIETSVGEFAHEQEARTYFHDTYAPHEDVNRRVVLVRAPSGVAAGTVTAWWNYTEERRDPSLHWLAVKPEFQGRGLGRALVSHCLQILNRVEGNRAVFLHTQTWSHRAIAIYLRAGFVFVDDEPFGSYQNDFEQALPLLKTVLPSFLMPTTSQKRLSR